MSSNSDQEVRKLVDSFNKSDLQYMHVKTADFEVVLSNDASAVEFDRARSMQRCVEPSGGSASQYERPMGVMGEHRPAEPPEANPEAGGAATPTVSGDIELVVISAPSVGLLYLGPAPGEAPYVTPGDDVSVGATMGLIEAMKVYTAVESSTAGVVVNVLAGDGDFVEFGQPLFELRAATSEEPTE